MDIFFSPSGLKKEVSSGDSILSVAQEANISIRSLCGGNGQCRQCWVEISEGNFAKLGIDSKKENVSPPTALEKELIAKSSKLKNKRLACQCSILGDLVVEIPETSQEQKSYISKKNKQKSFEVDSDIVLVDCELQEATLDENTSATENLLDRLKEQNIEASFSNNLLKTFQKKIADTKGKIRVAILDSEIIAIYPQDESPIIGAACDLGSTTIAIYIYDLLTGNLLFETSAMNPQIKFGEDLMSRVSYVMMNKDGSEKLTKSVQEKIRELLLKSCKKLKLSEDRLLKLVLVGNPIMHHLFFGISPIELGQAPFTVATRDWLDMSSKELGLNIFDNTRVSFLPLIAGHVGADTAGAILSSLPILKTKTALLVDIGTNAEIVLSKNSVIYSTSSPTGPAFEGAEISCGVRASFGAIERVRIDTNTFEVKYKVIGNDFWSNEEGFIKENITPIGLCGSGIIEAIVELARASLIDKSGLFVEQEAVKERFSEVDGMKRFLLVDNDENSLYIEQFDIRSIQLAKAALSAGVSLLMDYQDCDSFDEILLAGAFGTHLSPEYVADLDIIPAATKSNFKILGNAAGVGASMCLLDKKFKKVIIDEVKNIAKIETAVEPKFQDYFVDAMKFSVSKIEQQQSSRRERKRVRRN